MSIKQIKPNLYRIDISAWRDGREYRRREMVEGGKKAATDRAYEVKKDLAAEVAGKGSLTFRDISTFSGILDFYQQNNDLTKSKVDSYFTRLRAIGDTPVYDLSRVFKEYIRLEKKDCAKRTGKPLSVGTINKLKTIALAACNYAAREERIRENPLKNIRKETEEPRQVILSAGDEQRIIETAEKVAPHILPFIRFMLAVPARCGEMIRARKEHYNYFRNTINLPGELTKNGRPCIKPVPPSMTAFFQETYKNPACPWLFYRFEAGQYKPLGNIQKAWERVIAEPKTGWNLRGEYVETAGANLPGLRKHDLRHHAVTKLIDAGNPRQWVMSVAGWSCDMLKVYWNQDGEKVAEGIIFEAKPDTSPDTLPMTGPKMAEIA